MREKIGSREKNRRKKNKNVWAATFCSLFSSNVRKEGDPIEKQDGEETEKLLLEHYDELYRLAYCYVKTETDALDIVQEAAYKAFKNCGKVREPAYLKTWICRIVINTALDFIRSRDREFPDEEEMARQASAETVDYDLCSQESLKEMLKCLGKEEKTIILLKYVHDFKLEEIADLLGEKTGTVKARMYRALKKLRVDLETEA